MRLLPFIVGSYSLIHADLQFGTTSWSTAIGSR
jgi:hypothetical protein